MASTRFLVVADTHDLKLTSDPSHPFRRPLPVPIDVVLHCGDLTENGGLLQHESALEMLGTMPAELKLVIAGNHDLDLDRPYCERVNGSLDDHEKAIALWKSERAGSLGVHYLEEGTHRFTLRNGTSFTVYASPYTPEYGESAFQYPTSDDRYNLPRVTPAHSRNVSTERSRIPSHLDVDILMTHGPPQYILDSVSKHGSGGCEHLRRAVCRVRPLLHCFGHIHSGWGCQRAFWKSQLEDWEREELYEYNKFHGDGEDDLLLAPKEFIGTNQCKRRGFAKTRGPNLNQRGKETLFVNAAIGVDDECAPTNAPWLVELELSQVNRTKRKRDEHTLADTKSSKKATQVIAGRRRSGRNSAGYED